MMPIRLPTIRSKAKYRAKVSERVMIYPTPKKKPKQTPKQTPKKPGTYSREQILDAKQLSVAIWMAEERLMGKELWSDLRQGEKWEDFQVRKLDEFLKGILEGRIYEVTRPVRREKFRNRVEYKRLCDVIRKYEQKYLN